VSALRTLRGSIVATAATYAALCAGARASSASPLIELSGGMGGQGGFNARSTNAGAASTYFNPALLVEADAGITLGVVVVSTQFGITVGARSPANDIPTDFENAQHADGGRLDTSPIPTSRLQNGLGPDGMHARPRQAAGTGKQTFAYQMIGLVQPFFERRLAVGLYALVPFSQFTGASAFFSDEREQYFTNSIHPELYADRMTATSLAFGLGGKITDRLSAGLSFTLSLKTGATTPTYLADAGQFQNILVDSKVDVKAKVSPHFGLSYRPVDRLRFTGTVHTPQKLEIETKFTFLLANGIEQEAGVNFVHAYLPWQVAVGSEFDLVAESEKTLSLVGTLHYAKWSDYIDRHGETPIAEYAWSDTISPTLGLRLLSGKVRTNFDLAYQPSPIPKQTGRTNYADNDKIGATLGADYQFDFLGASMRAGLQVLAYRLIPKTTQKLKTPTQADGQNHYPALVRDEMPDDAVSAGTPVPGRDGLQTNNPGYPGFSTTGWVFGGGVYLSVSP
jgi:long-chain fatty acid transport protein